MNKNDEDELDRLTTFLYEIHKKTELTANQKKALKKAALALSVSFIHGHRKEIEELYQNRNKKLTALQKQHLQSMGIKTN